MWPLGMSRQETEEFILENLDAFLDILLTAYGMTVDEIVMNHMAEDAAEYAAGCGYWEAC